MSGEGTDVASPKQRFVYTPEIAYFIIEDYVAGKSLAEIAERADMPPLSTINRWLHKNESFRQEFEEARALRALQYEGVVDSVMHGADQLEKDEVPAQRLKFDTATWLAEKNDPSRFGRKTTVSGDQNAPIQIVVSTGVPDPTPEQEPPTIDATGMIITKFIEEVIQDEVVDGNGD